MHQAKHAVVEGREAIHGLRASVVETNDLAMAMRTLGEELAANANSTAFQVHVEGTPRDLHPILRDEVYRITGEGIRNAFRHAEAKEIEVEIHYDVRWLCVRVRDDGKGIDPKLLSDDGREGHFGLRGMRERAKLRRQADRVERTGRWYGSGTEHSCRTRVHGTHRGTANAINREDSCEAISPKHSEKVMSDEASPIRILVADDHPIVREGVAALVGGQSDMRVVGEASNGREAIQQFRAHHPDVTLMDLQMPEMNGLDAMIAIRGEAPEARIIMLTTYAGDAQVQRAIKAGARGYLLKSSLHEELLQTIRAVYAGRKAISPEATYELAEHATDDSLTPAEIRVLRLIAQGDANKEIAEQLSISEETVKGQVRNILSKLGAKDRTQAAMIGVKRGIIEL